MHYRYDRRSVSNECMYVPTICQIQQSSTVPFPTFNELMFHLSLEYIRIISFILHLLLVEVVV
jgi:hypothetical protein